MAFFGAQEAVWQVSDSYFSGFWGTLGFFYSVGYILALFFGGAVAFLFARASSPNRSGADSASMDAFYMRSVSISPIYASLSSG